MANGGSARVRTPFPKDRFQISAALIVLGSLRRGTANLSFVSQGIAFRTQRQAMLPQINPAMASSSVAIAPDHKEVVMKISSSILAKLVLGSCLVATVLQCSTFAQDTPSPLTIGDESHRIHILPTRQEALKLDVVPGAALTFHNGPVMSNVQIFVIFWVPPTLQNGNLTAISPSYRAVQESLLSGYPQHGIGNNNTQYYSSCYLLSYIWNHGDDFKCQYWIRGDGTIDHYYVGNQGDFRSTYVDTKPYPSGGCTNPAPGIGTNCISDADLQQEILLDVNSLTGWTGGRNQMILVYTSSGEGSCLQQGQNGDACSYVAPPSGSSYCGYHSYLALDGPPGDVIAVIYSNEAYAGAPWGDVACQFSPPVPSPNNDPAADAAASIASQELTDATTDPLLNAWHTTVGAEIGDLCLNWTNPALTFGTNTWDNGNANQMWNGSFFELQTEYDNHTSSCVQLGP